ncbi:hypothetical protein SAMN04489712_120110 [Thermomonospora echinospora]|uniref:Uncharacterized protein n=1 Tax=Thermomonospora echinospora TaxID=1992 RepID=A0A1H6DPM0_9ACTN|nr:hypothetical protein [Thermomonospora echinospora]SEG87317.1 hypothetical protein SAMN04489712_120110 [Thermomonospora echinospora]
MDLATVAHELYEVRPEEFTDARKRLVTAARSAGDAGLAGRIGRLRKPTVSAWAVNRLSRAAGDDLAGLLRLGAELRAAWSSGGPIAELEQRRGEIVARLLRTAERLAADAGRPLRETALREVEDTLQAAAVDPDVAEEVRTGTLDRPRSHTGFAPAAFAVPPGPPTSPTSPAPSGKDGPPATLREPPKPSKAPREQRAERERQRRAEAARAAERRAEEADRARAEWESEVAAARRELDERTAETDELRRRLDEALDRREAAERRVHVAHRELARASRAADEARRRAAETARTARR